MRRARSGIGCSAHERRFRPRASAGLVLRRPLSRLSALARARAGQASSRRRHLLEPSRRSIARVSRHRDLQLRQEAGVRRKIRRRLASLPSPHDKPGVQRRALSCARAAHDHGRADPARFGTAWSETSGTRGPSSERSGREARHRRHRRFRRRHSRGGDRRSSARAGRGPRAAARLVARDPGRAGAGAVRRRFRARRAGARRVPCPICAA